MEKQVIKAAKHNEQKLKATITLTSSIEFKLKKILNDNTFKKVGTLAVDLADIKESCDELIKLIPPFSEQIDKDHEKAANCLVEIETEMDHIVWHAKQSKKKIDLLANILYGEDDEEKESVEKTRTVLVKKQSPRGK